MWGEPWGLLHACPETSQAAQLTSRAGYRWRKEELLDQGNSLRLKCSKWSCVSHALAAADTQAAAAARRGLRLSAEPSAAISPNQAQHRPKPVPDGSAPGSDNSCHQLQIRKLTELVWKGISDEHPSPCYCPAAWQTLLTIHRLPQVSPSRAVSSRMESGRGSGSPV